MQALKLNPSIRAIIKCLQPWHQLQSLTLSNALTQRDVAAVGKLTQLQSRIMGGEGLGEVIDVGCLSALVRLQNLSLSCMMLTGLPLLAQACSGLTQPKLAYVNSPSPPQAQPNHFPPCPHAPGPLWRSWTYIS